MEQPPFRFILYAIIVYHTGFTLTAAVPADQPSAGNGTHFCGVIDVPLDKRYSDQFPHRQYARTAAANLNVGEPRVVRLIYFLPNDRPYDPDAVQSLKDQILTVQTFFAEQMEAHGYGQTTFRIETDPKGDPMVHRVDGRYSDSHYLGGHTAVTVYNEIELTFNPAANIYIIGIDTSKWFIQQGGSIKKEGGWAGITIPGAMAHELGHAFGLGHDFRDGRYLMSYGFATGGGADQLAKCSADFLSVHPYFNSDSSTQQGTPPTIELLSPRAYPLGSQSVSVRLKISDRDGLHQVLLHAAQAYDNRWTLKMCSRFTGEKDTNFQFDYDGVIPSAHDPEFSVRTSLDRSAWHPILVEAINVDGNRSFYYFRLVPDQPLTKISGDNQHGLPNTQLPVPLVVQVLDLDTGDPRGGIPITFAITAGDGVLSLEHTETDNEGRAYSTLTLGPTMGTNTVVVSAATIEGAVTFTAVGGAAVDIPDAMLRAAMEDVLDKAAGEPIAPAEIVALSRFETQVAGISNLTGLDYAINLTALLLYGHTNITDISPLVGLNHLTWLYLSSDSITDLSPLTELTNLIQLELYGNSITDLSPLAELTNLTSLDLEGNSVTDLSPLAELTNLGVLTLRNTNISDISALAELTYLYFVELSGNAISDLSPLVANTGWGNEAWIDVRGNPLSYQSIHAHIPILQERGIEISFDNQSHPALVKISGDNQNGSTFTALPQPFIVEVQDADGSPLAEVSVMFAVTAGSGTFRVTDTKTDTNGRAQSTLTLGPNFGTNTVSVSASGIQVPVTFTAISDSELPPMAADINGDGIVNVLDLLSIVSRLEQSGQNEADINGDRIVSIEDLALAARMLGE